MHPDHLVHLSCGHDYCNPCLIRLFETRLANSAASNVHCCGENIDVDSVEHFLPTDIIRRLQQREAQNSTSNGSTPAEAEDPAFEALIARREYQRCTSCGRVFEHGGGCNHMVCHCGREFCFLCGGQYGECGCPQFGGAGAGAYAPMPPLPQFLPLLRPMPGPMGTAFPRPPAAPLRPLSPTPSDSDDE
ncbi:MAG: hypothetical protein M1828_006898 [Chrysothrix sp. TS-e1954]|nr:MAG: hypothetical protein M1828_006898 [Chrysothrix sp. TS-e1954]